MWQVADRIHIEDNTPKKWDLSFHPSWFRDSSALNTNQYTINVKGEEVARGEILTDYYLALEPTTPISDRLLLLETRFPAYGIPGKWITSDKKKWQKSTVIPL